MPIFLDEKTLNAVSIARETESNILSLASLYGIMKLSQSYAPYIYNLIKRSGKFILSISQSFHQFRPLLMKTTKSGWTDTNWNALSGYLKTHSTFKRIYTSEENTEKTHQMSRVTF